MITRPIAAAVVVAAALSVTSGQAQKASPLASLKTTAESSDFKSTSTYEDVVKFMKAVADAAPTVVHYSTYGTTNENRAMPIAIVGTGLKDSSPAAVKATGRLRVHIQGNIHAGEVEGKEAAQNLLRELAMGKHNDWLKSMVFLITPIFNADGNERFSPTNRRGQNGPINGMGTRQNAQGLNINRDFMKLETPEGRAFVKLWNDYDPQVGFDLHTSDGSFHGYYLTYSPPLNPDTSAGIMSILKDEWFPFVTKNIKSKHGWDTFYYGNVSGGGRGGGGRGAGAPGGAPGAAGGDRGAGAGRAGGGAAGGGGGQGRQAGPPPPMANGNGTSGFSMTPPTPEVVGATPQPGVSGWATFEHVPRFHNNYVGMRNRFGLLSEAYAYATFEDRIKATNYFLEEALNFANQNVAKIKKACDDADKEKLVGLNEGTRAAIKTGPGTVEILMGEVEPEANPVTGDNMNRRKDVVHPTQMRDQMWFAPTKIEDVPAAYYVPAEATKALELLRLHGIEMKQVTKPIAGVEQFTITTNTARPGNTANPSMDLGTHGLRTLDGTWAPAPATVTVPVGAWEVLMNQRLARLAFYLLAPTSDDGVTNWNFLDDILKDGQAYPILRKK